MATVGTHRRAPRKERIIRIFSRPFRSVVDASDPEIPDEETIPEAEPQPEWRKRRNCIPEEYGMWLRGRFAGRVWQWGNGWYASIITADRESRGLGSAFSLESACRAVEESFGFSRD